MDAIKEQLPDMLEEIQHCKELADAHLMLYRFMIAECIHEAVNPSYDGGYWTRREAMEETYRNYREALGRKKHLEWVVRNIKNFAKNT